MPLKYNTQYIYHNFYKFNVELNVYLFVLMTSKNQIFGLYLLVFQLTYQHQHYLILILDQIF